MVPAIQKQDAGVSGFSRCTRNAGRLSAVTGVNAGFRTLRTAGVWFAGFRPTGLIGIVHARWQVPVEQLVEQRPLGLGIQQGRGERGANDFAIGDVDHREATQRIAHAVKTHGHVVPAQAGGEVEDRPLHVRLQAA